jgi:hypothetical protein
MRKTEKEARKRSMEECCAEVKGRSVAATNSWARLTERLTQLALPADVQDMVQNFGGHLNRVTGIVARMPVEAEPVDADEAEVEVIAPGVTQPATPEPART